MSKLSIIIPAYNEAKTIRRLVEKILAIPFPIDFEVIIVDDSSKDRTYRIAKLLNERDLSKKIRLFRNDANRGKGYSLQQGFQNVTGDIVVVQDADFEYDPVEIPSLMQPILAGRADVIYGSRFLGALRPQGMAWANCIANHFLTFLTNVLYGSRLTDMETCYKLMRVSILKELSLSARRFDFEPEITSQLLKKKIKIQELPISYHGRTASEGKKIKARDFFIAVWVLLINRFKP